tara:strand:+ start:2627 stop:3289 length:663 start_codon:yes stop_codon:yes gene_type:complete
MYYYVQKLAMKAVKEVSIFVFYGVLFIDMFFKKIFQHLLDNYSILNKILSLFVTRKISLIHKGKLLSLVNISKFENISTKFDDDTIIIKQEGTLYKLKTIYSYSDVDGQSNVNHKLSIPFLIVTVILTNRSEITVLLKTDEYNFYVEGNVFNFNFFSYLLNNFYVEWVKNGDFYEITPLCISKVVIISFGGEKMEITRRTVTVDCNAKIILHKPYKNKVN